MPNQSTNVLLVEDNEIDALMIERHLVRSDDDFKIHRVKRMSDCFQQLAIGSFDVVLLDLGLPDSSGGIETLKDVHEADGEIPIVVVTGLEDKDVAIESVRLGAQDFVVKDNADVQSLARTVRYAIERVEHLKMERRLRETEEQFRAAHEIQQALLPVHAPSLDGFEIAGRCSPMDAAGGDYYDYLPMSSGHFGLVIGDVSGHGVGPAMVMTATRTVFQMTAKMNSQTNPVEAVNRILSPDMPAGRFVTLLFVKLNVADATFEYTGAGHSALVFDSHGDKKDRLKAQGPPINAVDNVCYEESEPIKLEQGDTLLLYTDGITETQSPNGEMLGSAGMMDIVKANSNESAIGLLNALFESARTFREDGPRTDDMTAVVLKRL